MLVLSRKPNEEILIGDNIKITVLKVKGNTVRIGIEAPSAVKVKRAELPDTRSAANTSTGSNSTGNSTGCGELELTVSFSPSEEGVSAGKEIVAKQDIAAKKRHADVLSFESAANKSRRKPAAKSLVQAPEALLALPSEDSADRGHGTNRIKEILHRLVSGLPADELAND